MKGFSSHDGGKTFAPEFLLPHEHEPTRKRKRSPSPSSDVECNNYDADDETPSKSCEGVVAEENARSRSDESNYTDTDEEIEQLHREFNEAMNCDSDNSPLVSRKNLMHDFEMAESDVEENESVSIDKGC